MPTGQELTRVEIVESVKEAINQDIVDKKVPTSIASFTALHLYVDANSYIDGLVEDMSDIQVWVSTVYAVTDEIDAWLKAGRPD